MFVDPNSEFVPAVFLARGLFSLLQRRALLIKKLLFDLCIVKNPFSTKMAQPGIANTSFLWFRDFWARHQAPKPTIFIFGDTRTPKQHQKNHGTFSKNIICMKYRIFGNPRDWHVWKRRADPFKKIHKLMDMRSISIKKHEMAIG